MSSVVPFPMSNRDLARSWAGRAQMSCDPSPADLRAVLAANWSRFCVGAFADAHHCAAFFGVSRQCADNWRLGTVCRPSGAHVLAAVMHFGPALADVLAGAGQQARRAA